MMEDSDIANFLLLGIILIFIVLSLLAHCLVTARVRRKNNEKRLQDEKGGQEVA